MTKGSTKSAQHFFVLVCSGIDDEAKDKIIDPFEILLAC